MLSKTVKVNFLIALLDVAMGTMAFGDDEQAGTANNAVVRAIARSRKTPNIQVRAGAGNGGPYPTSRDGSAVQQLSDLRQTSVGEYFAAGQGDTVIRGKKECDGSHLTGTGNPPGWCLRDQRLVYRVAATRLRDALKARRIRCSGRQNVHPDACSFQVKSPASRKIADRCLGSAVNAERRCSHRPDS